MINKNEKMKFFSKYNSPVGILTLTSDGEFLTGVLFEKEFEEVTREDELPVFDEATSWLDRYFAGKNPSIDELKLRPYGSEFRMAVWELLKKIPYGQTVTYGELAKEIAVITNKEKMAAQAIGGAVGHNPISIIIPCHRVVGTNGSLTGFGGGLATKVKLLEHEGVNMSKFFIPNHL